MLEWCDEVNVMDFQVPLIIREDIERWLSKADRENMFSPFEQDNSDKQSIIQSYNEIFDKHNRIFLLGEPGVGKSTFCFQLINLWCRVKERSGQNGLRKIAREFDYVFLVTCREAKGSDSVLDMISKQLFPGLESNVVKNVISLKPDKSLVIIDGLDEWDNSGLDASRSVNRDRLPYMKDIEGCTVLITSRPWRVETLQHNLINCRVLDIKGLDEKGLILLSTKIFRTLGVDVGDIDTAMTILTKPLLDLGQKGGRGGE